MVYSFVRLNDELSEILKEINEQNQTDGSYDPIRFKLKLKNLYNKCKEVLDKMGINVKVLGKTPEELGLE